MEKRQERRNKAVKSIKKWRKASHQILKLTILLFIAIIGLQVLFRYYSDIIIGRVLSEIVSIQSKGLYRLEYESIHLNFIRREIHIKELYLLSDLVGYKSSLKSTDSQKNIYNLYIPEGQATGFSLLRAYLSKKIHFKTFHMVEPRIKILTTTSKSSKTNTLSQWERLRVDNLYTAIEGRLKGIYINACFIEDASVLIDHLDNIQDYEKVLNDISVYLENFHLDERSKYHENRFLYSDAADIRLVGQHLATKKNNYIIDIGEITVSTKKQQIAARNINLFPKLAQLPESEYKLQIPALTFSGANLKEILRNKQIKVRSAIFSKPSFTFKKHFEKISESQLKPIKLWNNIPDIYPLIPDYLHRLELDTMVVEHGYVTWKYTENAREESWQFPDLSAKFYNISIDSVQSRKYAYLDDFSLLLKNQIIALPGNDYYLSASKISLSTTDSIFSLKNARLSPAHHKGSYDIHVPEISFSGLDMQAVYQRKKLNCNILLIKNPLIKYYANANTNQSLPQTIEKEPKIRLNNIFKSVHIKKCYLQKGNFTCFQSKRSRLNKYLDAQNLSLAATHLSIEDTGQINIPHNLTFSLAYLSVPMEQHTHKLTLNNIRFSLHDSSLHISSGWLKSLPEHNEKETLPNSYGFSFDNFYLAGADWQQAYHNGTLKVAQASLGAVNLNQKNYTQLIKGAITAIQQPEVFFLPLKYITVYRTNINEGSWYRENYRNTTRDIQYVNSFKASADSLHICLVPNQKFHNRLFFSHLHFQAKDGGAYLADSLYNLHIQSVSVSSSTSAITIEQLAFSGSEENEGKYQLNIPQIQLKGVDINAFYTNNTLSASKIVFDHPQSKIHLWWENSQKSLKAFSIDSLYHYVKNQLTSIYVDDFRIVKAAIQLSATDKNKYLHQLNSEEVSVSIEDFKLDSLKAIQKNRLLYSKNIELAIHKYQYQLPDSIHELGFASLHLSTEKEKINIDSLYIQPFEYPKKDHLATRLLDILLPSTTFSAVDFQRLYQSQQLDIGTIETASPQFYILNNVPTKEKKNSASPLATWYKRLKPSLNYLHVDQVTIDNALVSLAHNHRLSQENFTIPNIFGQVNDFTLDSLSLLDENRFFGTQQTYIRIKNYQHTLQKNDWSIQADEIVMDTKKAELQIDGLALHPRFKKFDYSQLIGYQKDWLYISGKDILFKNFNYKDLLLNQAIKASTLAVSGMRIEAYRDKKLPARKNHISPTLQTLIKNLPIYLKIDSILVANSYIQYEELVDNGGKQPGFIYLSDLNGQIYNMTNDSLLVHKKAMTMNIQTYLMGSGAIKAFFYIPLNDPKGNYLYRGYFAGINMRELNPMLENIAYMQIKHGKAGKANFRVLANNHYAMGSMRFYYKNLKLIVLNQYKQRQKGGQKHKGILSFLTNTFIVRASNPKFIFLNRGNIYYKRRPENSPFNYWVKTLLNGIRTSMGIKKNTKPPKQIRKEVKANQKRLRNSLHSHESN